ncbi:MAG: SMI1/KNR4 family protein [Comamonas sp.]|jgi:cell wall assembly regulator SMI1|uniref:SMI1/KNR4 family protein n=1 Tax=Comamonas sp. TaxID=34028 RepID=UPI002835C470|nr:SMI1/KNR4 family protein [Comamonas sp.]MDR0212977.1 SMI1/KNR4 family protein [Comamonas sp.]
MAPDLRQDLQHNWNRIARWYATNTPQGTLVLDKGASEDEIAELETALGQRLPDDLRHSLSLHNGAANEGYLLYHGELLSTRGILKVWQMYRDMQHNEGWGQGDDYETEELQGPIRPVYWDGLRIPLTDNSGDAAMLDLLPAEGGQAGQIIEFDGEVGPRTVLASSFSGWIAQLADELEQGRHVYIEDAGCVAPPGTW